MRHSATHALLDARRRASSSPPSPASTASARAETYHELAHHGGAGRGATRATAAPRPRRHPVRAQRPRLPPRHVPRPRRHRRDLPRLRGEIARCARVLRRRGRVDHGVRPAARQRARRARQGRDLPRQPLRHARETQRAAPSTGIREELASGSTELASQNKLLEAQRLEQRTLFDLEMMRADGLLLGHRELLAPPLRAQAGRAAACLIDYFPEGLPARHRRVAPDASRRSARCTAATARARRRWSSTASACRRRSTTGRSSSTSSRRWWTRRSTSPPRPPSTSSSKAQGRGGRADHPPDRPRRSRRSRCVRWRARSTTCSRRSASARRQGSACSSRRSPSEWRRT